MTVKCPGLIPDLPLGGLRAISEANERTADTIFTVRMRGGIFWREWSVVRRTDVSRTRNNPFVNGQYSLLRNKN